GFRKKIRQLLYQRLQVPAIPARLLGAPVLRRAAARRHGGDTKLLAWQGVALCREEHRAHLVQPDVVHAVRPVVLHPAQQSGQELVAKVALLRGKLVQQGYPALIPRGEPRRARFQEAPAAEEAVKRGHHRAERIVSRDRKSTRLNSSHVKISY